MPSSSMTMTPEIKPKSHRRFLHFSSPFGSLPSLPSLSSTPTSSPHTPPVPPIPPLSDSLTSLSPRPPLRSQPSASSLGSGATIVRRPSDARREMIPNVGGGKAISHRSLSASAAAALSRSLTSCPRGETQPVAPMDQPPMDEFGRLDLSGKGRREIRISPPIPPRASGRMSVLPTPSARGREEGYSVEVMPMRTSDGSYTSSNSIGTTDTAGTDSTATDSIALKTPRTPYLPPTPRELPRKSAMRKSISPQVSLPNLGAMHPYVHAGTGPWHAAHPSIDSLASCTSINALTGRRERTPSRETQRRSTLKPPPKGALPPTLSTAAPAPAPMPAFHAILMGVSFIPAIPDLGAADAEIVLVKLHFAYSLGANHDTSPITIPWNILLSCGGGLVDIVDKQLEAYRLSQSVPASKPSQLAVSTQTGHSQRGRRGSFAESVDSNYGDQDAETLYPAVPGLTDGDSAEGSDGVDSKRDSEYGYTELLRPISSSAAENRDEYLKSLWTDSPAQPDFTQSIPPMPITHAYPTPPKHRAKTRNQYVQKATFGSVGPTTTPKLPSLPPLPNRISPSPIAPLLIRRSPSLPNTAAPPVVDRGGGGADHARRPSVDSALPLARFHHTPASDRQDSGTGTGVLLVQVLLLRDAEAYHLITHRLLRGSWPVFAPGVRRKVEEEVRYLGMQELVMEVKREKSGVIKGGEGYI